MSLMRGQDAPQQMPQATQQMPQEKPKRSLIQKAIYREKWIVVICIVFGVFGLIEQLLTGKNGSIGQVLSGSAITFVFFSIANFTLLPWLQSIYMNSKRASEQFWNQK